MSDSKNEIINFFRGLDSAEIRYVLLRNIDDEIPNNYQKGKKDIDLLVHPDDRSSFHGFMKKQGYVLCPHPLDKGKGLTYLYAVYPFEFYKRNGVLFDVCYQMVCKSPNAGEYMPVDIIVNDSVWKNRIKNERFGWYELGAEDMIVHLLTRCVFDKQVFPDGYRAQIGLLLPDANIIELKKRLEKVFFRYTDLLLSHLGQGEFDEVIHDYYTFREY